MSTTEQIKGDSLRRQVDASEKYALANGLRLVDDFKLHDIGVSAFKGANAARGALSIFLAAVENGDIPPGSYLLVESLDRLSREKIRTAMQLLWDITQAGINVVTLADNQVYRAGQDDLQSLLYSIVVMSRANEESQIKSHRLSSAWERKRADVETRKLTKLAPAWLILSNDGSTFIVDQTKGAIVQQIFDLALHGMGKHSIVRMLNSNKVSPFGRSEGWSESYVEKILKSRAVIGEFQPHRVTDGVRRPTGEPIRNYYPPVVTEDVFLRVQAARRDRSVGGGGRKGATNLNVFSRLVTCAYCGGKMRMVDKGKGPKGGRYLKCSNAVRKLDCTVIEGWRYDNFEASFFQFVEEADLGSLLRADEHRGQLEHFAGKVVAIDERIKTLEGRRDRTFELMDQSDLSIAYVRDRLEEIERHLDIERDELEQAKAALAVIESQAKPEEDLTTAIETLKAIDGAEAFEVRSKIAHHLSQLVVTLKLAVKGREATRPEIATFLAEHEPDAAFREQLMSHIVATHKERGLDHPTFTVTFKGGQVRIVTVDGKHPTRLIQIADVTDHDAIVTNEKVGHSWSP